MARQVDLKALYGGQIASRDVVQKGMGGLAQELSKRHNERESQRAAARQHQQQVSKPLLDLVGKDPGASQGVQGLRSLHQMLKTRKVTAPEVPKETSRTFTS